MASQPMIVSGRRWCPRAENEFEGAVAGGIGAVGRRRDRFSRFCRTKVTAHGRLEPRVRHRSGFPSAVSLSSSPYR